MLPLLLSGLALAGVPVELSLCQSAAMGDVVAVQRLISQGADVNAQGRVRIDEPVSDEGMFWRVLGSIATGGLIIPILVDIDRPQWATYHGLTCALGAEEPSRPVVDALFAAGADPERPSPGAALTVYLAGHSQDGDAPDWVRYLRGHGAQPAEVLRTLIVEDRPIDAALPPVVDLLIHDGATNPGCWAAQRGDLAMLLASGVDPKTTICRLSEDPRTLLYVASEAGRLATVIWLLDQGADMELVPESEPTGRTGFFKKKATYSAPPLQGAILSSRTEVVALLLSRGASISTLDTSGKDALYAAMWRPELLPMLLDATDRATAITWAMEHLGSEYHEGLDLALRGWLPPDLARVATDPQSGPAVRGLTRAWWRDALAEASMDEVVAVLTTPFGARAPELALERNTCLARPGEDRDALIARWGKPTTSKNHIDHMLPPPGTRRNLFGRAPNAPYALSVTYEEEHVATVTVLDAAAVRAGGCDAPALRVASLPSWRRAWEYGPFSDESYRYGLSATGAWTSVSPLGEGLSLRFPFE